jgi:hypothetical protein
MSHADPTKRGHRGLIAVAIVVASGGALWLATVAIVRHSANSAFEAEVARLRAAGALVSTEMDAAWGPQPPAGDDAMVNLRAMHALWRDLEVATEHSSSLPTHERRHVSHGYDSAEFASFDHDVWERLAEIDPERRTLALARQAADKPALWMEKESNGRERDQAALLFAGDLLERAVIDAAHAGDDETARADVVRLLKLRGGLDRQPWFMTYDLQAEFTEHVSIALGSALAQTSARPAWMELDALLAAIDPGASVRRQLHENVSSYVSGWSGPLSTWSVGTWPGDARDRAWNWPSSAIRRADELEKLVRFEPIIARGLGALLADSEFEIPPVIGGCLSGDPRDWDKHVMPAAREQVTLTLLRAALRARFDGPAAADAFLVQHPEPFTNRPIVGVVDVSGRWTVNCSGARPVAGAPDWPDETYDVRWPPKE